MGKRLTFFFKSEILCNNGKRYEKQPLCKQRLGLIRSKEKTTYFDKSKQFVKLAWQFGRLPWLKTAIIYHLMSLLLERRTQEHCLHMHLFLCRMMPKWYAVTSWYKFCTFVIVLQHCLQVHKKFEPWCMLCGCPLLQMLASFGRLIILPFSFSSQCLYPSSSTLLIFVIFFFCCWNKGEKYLRMLGLSGLHFRERMDDIYRWRNKLIWWMYSTGN